MTALQRMIEISEPEDFTGILKEISELDKELITKLYQFQDGGIVSYPKLKSNQKLIKKFILKCNEEGLPVIKIRRLLVNEIGISQRIANTYLREVI